MQVLGQLKSVATIAIDISTSKVKYFASPPQESEEALGKGDQLYFAHLMKSYERAAQADPSIYAKSVALTPVLINSFFINSC